MYNSVQNVPSYRNDFVEMPVSVGEWIGVFILSCIPIVNFIMMLVWAFGGGTKQSKQNYARANLIIMLIGLGLLILLTIVSLILGSLGLFSIASIFDNYYY